MYENILVPVSFDEARDAGAALDVARALAEDGAKFTLLHVIEEIPAYALTAQSPAFLLEATRAAEETLGKMAAKLGDAEVLVVDGHAARTILDVAADKAADCIVMASHRPGLQDYLLGSAAAHVVRHAACSVHVLR